MGEKSVPEAGFLVSPEVLNHQIIMSFLILTLLQMLSREFNYQKDESSNDCPCVYRV